MDVEEIINASQVAFGDEIQPGIGVRLPKTHGPSDEGHPPVHLSGLTGKEPYPASRITPTCSIEGIHSGLYIAIVQFEEGMVIRKIVFD